MSRSVIFITGGNSGIGLATALKFAASGCDVSLLSRREAENERARSQVEEHGVRCVTFAGDVGRAEDVAAAVDQTCRELGRLDYAFNNAGIDQQHSSLISQTEDDYQEIMDTNVKGVWLCMQQQIPRMLEAGGGVIVNTGSVASLVGSPRMPLYVASKHAVLGMTRAVALEYAAKNIRVNAVCPAVVETPMFRRFVDAKPEVEQTAKVLHPMGRLGTAEEIASTVYWLCTEASWTTGQSITVDGGFTAM